MFIIISVVRASFKSHLVAVLDSLHNLCEEAACLGLLQPLLLPYVVEQLPVREVLHG